LIIRLTFNRLPLKEKNTPTNRYVKKINTLIFRSGTIYKEAKDRFEKNYLSNMLSLTGGNVSKAAKLAGKYRSDFYVLLKKHGLNALDFKK
jgi:DNA-binding NtrC family response regulator